MLPTKPYHRIQKGAYVLFRVLIGIAFIWASYDKILDPSAFAQLVSNYQILPPLLINPTALILPWIEAICGILMVIGYGVRGSGLLLGILLLAFILALAINMYRGIDIACGCFSLAASHSTDLAQLIVRDLVMLVGLVWVCYYKVRSMTTP